MYRSRSNSFSWFYVIIVGLFVIFGVAAVGTFVVGLANVNVITCTVDSKDRTAKYKGGSDMRVYTRDCGVLAVDDSILDGRFNSADIYSSIKEGQRYNFKTRGIRAPIFSMFPNIVDVKPA